MARTMTSATGTDDDSSFPEKKVSLRQAYVCCLHMMLSVLRSSVVQGVMISHDATTNTTTSSNAMQDRSGMDGANAKQP